MVYPLTAGFAFGRPATTGEYPSATSGAGGHTWTLGGFSATGGVDMYLTTGDGTPTIYAYAPATNGALGVPTIVDGVTTADHGPYGMFAPLTATPFITFGIAPGEGTCCPLASLALFLPSGEHK